MQIEQIKRNREYWDGEREKMERGEASLFMEETSLVIDKLKVSIVDIQNLIFPINNENMVVKDS